MSAFHPHNDIISIISCLLPMHISFTTDQRPGGAVIMRVNV